MLSADIEDQFRRNSHFAFSKGQQRHSLDLAWKLDTQTYLRRMIMSFQPLVFRETQP
jgi:hypothetical protein